jgi:general stress protein 26
MKAKEKAERLYKKARRIIICSGDADGYPLARAVLPVKGGKNIGEIYFTTNTSSRHVAEYTENPKAGIYFFNPVFYQGCLLKGAMEIVTDLEI